MVARPTTRNSVRIRPTPSAPLRAAGFGFLGEVDVRAQRDAHAVERDRPRASASSRAAPPRPAPPRAARSRYAVDLRRRVGLMTSMPVRAVEHHALAAAQLASSRSRSPTTAGRPSERARIATCDVRVPASVAMRGDRVAVELHGEARRQVVRDEDRVRALAARRPDRGRAARAAATARGCARR